MQSPDVRDQVLTDVRQVVPKESDRLTLSCNADITEDVEHYFPQSNFDLNNNPYNLQSFVFPVETYLQ